MKRCPCTNLDHARLQTLVKSSGSEQLYALATKLARLEEAVKSRPHCRRSRLFVLAQKVDGNKKSNSTLTPVWTSH